MDPQNTTLKLDMYYTGITDAVMVAVGEGTPSKYSLARDYSITLPVVLPSRGIGYFVMTRVTGNTQ